MSKLLFEHIFLDYYGEIKSGDYNYQELLMQIHCGYDLERIIFNYEELIICYFMLIHILNHNKYIKNKKVCKFYKKKIFSFYEIYMLNYHKNFLKDSNYNIQYNNLNDYDYYLFKKKIK